MPGSRSKRSFQIGRQLNAPSSTSTWTLLACPQVQPWQDHSNGLPSWPCWLCREAMTTLARAEGTNPIALWAEAPVQGAEQACTSVPERGTQCAWRSDAHEAAGPELSAVVSTERALQTWGPRLGTEPAAGPLLGAAVRWAHPGGMPDRLGSPESVRFPERKILLPARCPLAAAAAAAVCPSRR